MARCVELGHALGNQHWAAVVKGRRVYVPLAVSRAVMASVMKTHSFEGVTYAFVPGADVIAHLAPREARRLFGTPPRGLKTPRLTPLSTAEAQAQFLARFQRLYHH